MQQYDILTYILMSYNLISQLVLLLFITNVSEVWAKFVSGTLQALECATKKTTNTGSYILTRVRRNCNVCM